jgi:hypothetical protein
VPLTAQDLVVSAHTAKNGCVWRYATATPGPVATRMEPDAFVASLPPSATIRVLADRVNDDLLGWLSFTGIRCEIGRPARVRWADAIAAGPRTTLVQMQRSAVALPASLGGWRPFGPADIAVRRMAAASGAGDAELAAEALAEHPIGPALAFIPHLDLIRAAGLMGTIIDPRFFVTRSRPDREARLRCYLGLDCFRPKYQAARMRQALAVGAWKGRRGHADSAAGGFLWRYWMAREERYGVESADVWTTRYFLRFLRAAWLDAVTGLHDLRTAGPSDPRRSRYTCHGRQGLFVPEHLFVCWYDGAMQPDRETATAFTAHMRRIGAWPASGDLPRTS